MREIAIFCHIFTILHSTMASVSDTSSDVSSGDDAEQIEMTEGQIYDVKDKHGRWFEGQIVKISRQEG